MKTTNKALLWRKTFSLFSVKREMPILFFVNCERTVLFSVKRDLDPPLYHPLVCGIPQGSILGHLLFIIYINDLPNASNLLKTFLFEDDTSLFYSHKDPNQLIHLMNCELPKIFEWLKLNKLSLNVAKTNYILFRPRQKPITVSDTITLDNFAVQQVEVTKFFGVLLDQHLSWKYHINHVAKKVSKTIGIISKARFFLSCKSLLSL